MRQGIVIIAFLAIAIFLISCTPPGAQSLSDIAGGKSVEPVQEVKGDVANETKEETPVGEVNETAVEKKEETSKNESTSFTDKKVVCRTGTFSCKDTKLIECRSGKLIKKEDCKARGCYVNHCGECDTAVAKECVGNKLVTCTKDARKKTKQCYRCENLACVEAPENPEPLMCSKIASIESDAYEGLTVFSVFKKKNVNQELEVYNDHKNGGFKLGTLYANSGSEIVKGGSKGKSPVYVEISKCYIFCQVEIPIKITLRCEDGQEVTATIPPHTASSSKRTKFFIAEEGSTFYGDSDKNGQGVLLSTEKIYTKEQLAVKSNI